MSSLVSAREDRLAHEKAVRLPAAQVVADLREILGATLVAYLGGVKETRAVAEWAAGKREPSSQTMNRLRTAFRVATLLRTRDNNGVVRAWFQGMNPHLEDVAPARVLRGQPLEEAGPAVISVARAFVAAG